MHLNQSSPLSSSKNVPSAGNLDLSVVMVAMNEERTIAHALAAVKSIAREIIVVDSGSTDNTIGIAASFGAQVVHRDWKGYADQKNYALGLASCNWILNIDADEILSPDLVAEIEDVLSVAFQLSDRDEGKPKNVGFKLPRVLLIGDIPVWHGGFYPDAQLRLIRKGVGQFKDRLVHESIFVNGPVLTLKNHMIHKAYATVEEFRDTLDKYAQLSAQESLRRSASNTCPGDGRKDDSVLKCFASHLNQWLHPAWTFFYRYILRAGFLDGALGFQLACIYSNYVAKKIRYQRKLIVG
jgi:glycosyltransferase involved in cell wall biosynthesis